MIGILLAAGIVAGGNQSDKAQPTTGCDLAGPYRFRFLSNGHDGWWFRFEVEGTPAKAMLVEDVEVLALKAGRLHIAADPAACKFTLSTKGKAVGKLAIVVDLDAKSNTISGKLTRTKATDAAEQHLSIKGVRDLSASKPVAACIVPGIYQLDLDPTARWRNPIKGDKRSCKSAGDSAGPVFVRVEPFGGTLAITKRESDPPYKEAWAEDSLTQHDDCTVTATISDSTISLEVKLKFAGDTVTGTAIQMTQQMIEDGDEGENIWDCVGKKIPVTATRRR